MKQLFILACMPLAAMSEPPPEQDDCHMEHCEICKTRIWVSGKKRKLRKANTKDCQTICLYCAAIIADKEKRSSGHEIEVQDLLDTQY